MDKIIGLGNALVDVLAALNDENKLKEMGLPKGSMTLIDQNKYLTISNFIKTIETKKATGGSAGNVIRTAATLGGECGFIGKINNDYFGNFFLESLTNRGITPKLLHSEEYSTGVASTFITPDGERTFATYLGAAATLKAEDLSIDLFKGYTYLFIEGYLVQDHDMILRAIELAEEAGLQICLDMASYNIVNEDLEFFTMLVNKYVDIVFANEEEAKAFTKQKTAEDALEVIGKMCSIAIVKVGAKGSYIRKGTESFHIPAVEVDRVIDTTGAGDFFAGGFLYGLSQGISLEKCATIGSITSANVIQYIGAAIPDEGWKAIKEKVEDCIR